MNNVPRFGIWLALAGTLFLTFDALLMRLSEMTGLQMTAWRGFSMGSVLILLWLVQSRTFRRDLSHVATWPGLLIMACQFFNSLLFCLGIAIAPVAVVLIGLAAVPVFAAIFAWLIIGERAPAATWITIVFVMGGIGLAVSGKPDGIGRFDMATLTGALLGLGVAVVLAMNFVTLRARPELPIALLIGCGALVSGCISFLIIGPQEMGQGVLLPMLLTGAVVLPASFFSLSFATRYTQASNVSLIMLLETAIAPVWVWMVIGEAPTLRMLVGGGIVIVSLGAFLILTGRRAVPAA